MSPRAAARLETLGFAQVFDFEAGKQAWLAAGLPREGQEAGAVTLGDLASADVPTCRLAECVGDVRSRVEAAGWNICVVVDGSRTVLGLLRDRDLRADPDLPVEIVMEPGPSSFRPNVMPAGMKDFMRGQNLAAVLVTTHAGSLVGVVVGEANKRLREAASAA
jgi:Mg/Co/Ni transporter MgtE